MHKYKLYAQPRTQTVHFVTVRGKGQESALLKWRWIRGLIYDLPSPTFTPSFLLSRSLPLVLQMSQSLFPYSSPPPSPVLSSRVKHHYIITQAWIIVMVVCEAGERLGELGVAGVEMVDKRESDNVKWIFCYNKCGIPRFGRKIS